MDNAITLQSNTPVAQEQPILRRWEACLNLDFSKRHDRSYLAKNFHVGPLVLQKTLHPEGDAICHGIIIHPPGGVAGGDELTLKVTLAPKANVLLTTPGAGKWYKANGSVASQHLQFDLAENASLEWLPQENILFDGSEVNFSADIHLSAKARYAGWEILCFGRQAKGERWDVGKLRQSLSITRRDKLIWQERAALKANDPFFHSLIGMAGNVVSAAFVVAAGAVPAELLAKCRQLQMEQVEKITSSQTRFGVTALPEVFSARYIGMSAPEARQFFEALWHILRPWYLDRTAVRPRIWNT
ncbi:MAG: urease accessory protein UreD [Methylotenera sp.]|nr:urease accessory protein UreD [Methylotenera sp.]MDO9390120.1 urease accessory protein UreD [Methylotenera sp.]MDP2101839.1 urease accessory protein UreD [Methylotenera sp.]MDP2281462.1 urease accessory protein UreD [Methylotenera sp.]MDP3060181.1 urease accessory protein UreD [Methylotenera sp.]